jgi:4,5-DOPA dioxygenase extradiol
VICWKHTHADVAAIDPHRDFSRAVPTPDHFLPLLSIAGLAGTQGFDLLVEGHARGSILKTAYTVGLDCDTSGVSAAGPAAALPEDLPTMDSNL